MDRPCDPDEVRVQIINDAAVNAANAGGCQFFVTTGLLQRADDDRLLGVMAHEIAHQDLGHAVKAQMLGAGLNIGVALLGQIIPGSNRIAPLAGTLIARGTTERKNMPLTGVPLSSFVGWVIRAR